MSDSTALEELNRLLSQKSRRIFVAQAPIDLTSSEGENCVYVLELPTTAPGSAGGRVGGIGERRLQRLHCFRLQGRKWMRIFETDDESKLERFELPYHAAGLAVTLTDGTERVVSGVVDEDFVRRYNETV
jgi:hypothetical protein